MDIPNREYGMHSAWTFHFSLVLETELEMNFEVIEIISARKKRLRIMQLAFIRTTCNAYVEK